MKTFVLLGVTAILALGFTAVSDGQVDLAKVLVGKWEGQIAGTFPGNKARALTIKSVEDTRAAGLFGIPGGATKPVDIAIERNGNDTTLRFAGFSNAPTQLMLKGEKTLDGTVTLPTTGGLRDFRLQFDKVE